MVYCIYQVKVVDTYALHTTSCEEQIIVGEAVRRLRTKEDGGFHSDMFQNPSDPDAAFREKAGKKHQGYVAIWKKRWVKTVLSSRIISMSRTTTATASF